MLWNTRFISGVDRAWNNSRSMIGNKLLRIGGKAGFPTGKIRESDDCRLPWNAISSPMMNMNISLLRHHVQHSKYIWYFCAPMHSLFYWMVTGQIYKEYILECQSIIHMCQTSCMVWPFPYAEFKTKYQNRWRNWWYCTTLFFNDFNY